MMPGLPDDHPSIRYYDGDYPGTETSLIAQNLDSTLAVQGLAKDVDRFREIVGETDGRILEIGCGTGRVLIPLARAGATVTGVDISAAMIERLKVRLDKENNAVRNRFRLQVGDARDFGGEPNAYTSVIIPFNGLSCIPAQADQRTVLNNAARLLSPGGRLVIDVVNPFAMPLKGSGAPEPFFTRINPETERVYTRFAAMGPVEADQTQRLYGWYDEIGEDGAVYRTPYEMRWRLIFLSELMLLVETAGLEVEKVEGDHQKSAYTAASPKIFMIAVKPAC